MISIENEFLKIAIDANGAELNSIYDLQNGIEYMWQGDPAFWAKHSPVLFPIVGTLKSNTYFYKNKDYKLSRHGFARDMVFAVSGQTDSSVTFSLISTGATLEKYPFNFRFDIVYTLNGKQLDVSYAVFNEDKTDIYFSVGGHPAFNVPFLKNTQYQDYYLEFNKNEKLERWPISKDGLILQTPKGLLHNSERLPLTKTLFYEDALVFKHLASDTVSLKCNAGKGGFTFKFPDFPYLGIWAAKDADFVCIEPWCGIADSVETNQDIIQKEGINKLNAGESFKRTWSLRLF
ncbi:MAG: aldose 1-epimerase family protein [Agriterribacter sp.]